MQLPFQSRVLIRALGATVTAVALTGMLDWLGASATTAGLTFLVIVVWSATRAGLRLSLYIAVLCALLFDYFFLPPYHTLNLEGSAEWVAMVTFVASSVVAGRVSELARNQARHAEQRREEVERLYTLSQEMMLRDDAASLSRELPGLLQRIFTLDSVALYLREQERFFSVPGEVQDTLAARLRQEARGESASAGSQNDGFAAHALLLGSKSVGAVAWRPPSLSRELSTAVCAQVAIALTRAAAIETNARLEASRQSERLRVALIDSLTHELRTPLTSIRAAATTLMDGSGLDDAGRYDLAAIVDEEASRLDHLIGEAMEMAEIDGNLVKVQRRPHHPRALVQDAVEQAQALLSRHMVEIRGDEPDEPVWLDALLLERVLRHLLENAARYSPAGSRIVVASHRAGDRLEFTVTDEGPGIDAADLPLIFEKFFRGRNAAISGKGSGMGLAIARALLKAHGGGIDVASAPGQGTTFRFWIPLEPTAKPENDGGPNDRVAQASQL